MTESNEISVAAAKEAASGKAVLDRIIIRPFPKVVLLWPIMVASLLFFVLGSEYGESRSHLVDPSILGWWWMVVFFLNLMVHTFDFGRANLIAVVALLGAVLLGLWVWDLQTETAVYGNIYNFFGDQELTMHANTYAMIAGVLAVLMLMAFITTRFNYWVLSPNQLTHKHGILGDERHYSTLNMAVEKEIPDVFEFILFGSGRLIFKPGVGAESNKSLVVDNVFRVNKLEQRVREFLGVIRVDKVNS